MDDEGLTAVMQLAAGLVAGGAAVNALGYVVAGADDSALPPVDPGNVVPVGRMERLDGSARFIHLPHYLREAQKSGDALERSWWAGALLTLGDALSKEQYFDHAAELELVYHLRNAVAHGNHIHLTPTGLRRLERYPANNYLAHSNSPSFAVTPEDEGRPVLFDMLRPGDLADLFDSVGLYLAYARPGSPGLRPWLDPNWLD